MNFFLVLVPFIFTFIFAINYSSAKTLKVGDEAPAFTLHDENGKDRTLIEFKGKRVLLYFYPKDGTSGCTAQACGLRDNFQVYRDNNIVIIGVNYDDAQSHKKFKEDNNLPEDFILLSDSKKDVATAYGAHQGILKWFVPARISILIDEQGKVVDIMKDVDVKKHAAQLIEKFKLAKKDS